MAINIKLSDAVPIEGSVLNRTWYGWKESASPQTIYESNRGVWPLGSRARHERYATFSYHGTIRVAVEIDRIEELPVDNPNKRRAIVGRVLQRGDAMYDAFVGRPAPDNHRNPVTYFDDPK
jgi:hypothetical protein